METPEELQGALRQFKHNTGEDGFIFGFDHDETIRVFGRLRVEFEAVKAARDWNREVSAGYKSKLATAHALIEQMRKGEPVATLITGTDGYRSAIPRKIMSNELDGEELTVHPLYLAPTIPKEWIENIIKRIAELPDRNSPEDWPDAMLVTVEELKRILLDAALEPRK